MDYLNIASDTLVHFIANNVPYLNIAHIILCVTACNSEWNASTYKQNPFASFIFALTCTTAGGILTNVLTNEGSILGGLFSMDTFGLSVFVAAWWLTFYCPGGVFKKIVSSHPVIDILYVMKELLRCKKIWVGVGLAGKLYGKESLMHAIVLGTVASCGTGFMINLGHSISMRPYNGRILLSTSVFTKVSVVLSAIYYIYPAYKSYTLELKTKIHVKRYPIRHF